MLVEHESHLFVIRNRPEGGVLVTHVRSGDFFHLPENLFKAIIEGRADRKTIDQITEANNSENH